MTNYVSTAGGSFKPPGESGNWYGTDFGVSTAEIQPMGTRIYEYSKLRQDTPVWNMNKLPERFQTAIHNDRNLLVGRYFKSQFIVECLHALDMMNNASGIFFPSRRADGNAVILNSRVIGIEIIFTGQSLPDSPI